MFRTVGFYLVLFLCWSLRVEAQNIKVESFSLLENDITARVNVVKDANDDECALIKMVTTDAEYNLDEGLKRESRVGEIWFYVPQGTKRIVIRHQKLGKLVYELPEILKPKVTYQIRLPDNVEIIVHEDVGGQYLVMNVQPIDAVVYIDESPEVLNNGVLQKMLKYGQHTYRVEAPMHLSTQGKVVIGKERSNLDVKLIPDFGFLRLVSSPESGAVVYVDGKLIGKTPITTGRLEKGRHVIKSILPMYAPVSQEVTVEAGLTSDATLNFSANFAQITLSVTGAEIWVNGEQKGINSWSGRLAPGMYKLEARKIGYRPSVKTIELAAGEQQILALSVPTPMLGTLDVSSNEVDVTVKVDGEVIGVTPNVFKILEGKHVIEFSKKDWEPVTYNIEVKEGEVLHVNGVLDKQFAYKVSMINWNAFPNKYVNPVTECASVVIIKDKAYVCMASENNYKDHIVSENQEGKIGMLRVTFKGFYQYDFISQSWNHLFLSWERDRNRYKIYGVRECCVKMDKNKNPLKNELEDARKMCRYDLQLKGERYLYLRNEESLLPEEEIIYDIVTGRWVCKNDLANTKK